MILLLSRCILCILFSDYKVSGLLIAYFNLSQATHIPDEKKNFWKLLVHHWKSSNNAAFMEQPASIIFKVEDVLNLACWFSFDIICPNSMCKTYLFFNLGCSAKVASIFFFLWSTTYKVFSMWKVSWLLIVDFALLPTSYPNSTCKTFLF